MEAEEGRFEVIDIDLNEEPDESNYGEVLISMENAYSMIEERIRRLEAVANRASQPRTLSVEVVNEEPLSLNEETGRNEMVELPSLGLNSAPERRVDRLKRSENNLLALASETDGDVGESVQVKKNSGEAFFDCNICLRKARDPILTCCGHLFCWPCFYLLPDVVPDTKECPECKGNVTQSGITPIYGNSNKAHKTDADNSGLTIPPRPRAKRIESLRQQKITRASHFTIEEVLRSLRSFSTLSNNLSSTLTSAERLAEDLEGMTYIDQPVERRYRGPFDSDSNSNVLVDVPSEALVPEPSSSTHVAVNEVTSASNGMQSNSVTLSPRRIIRSQEHFTEQQQQQQILEQRRSIRRRITERRALILRLEENPPDARILIDDPELLPVRVVTARSSIAHNPRATASAIAESNETEFPSSIRRREYMLDTSAASGSDTPVLKRRRLE